MSKEKQRDARYSVQLRLMLKIIDAASPMKAYLASTIGLRKTGDCHQSVTAKSPMFTVFARNYMFSLR
jgi:hypothetical protein